MRKNCIPAVNMTIYMEYRIKTSQKAQKEKENR